MKVLIMSLILAIAALALVLTGPKQSSNYLTKVRETTLITKPGTFASTVRLVDPTGRTFCSGTVISEHLVLTAAHCVAGPTVVMSEPNANGDVVFTPTNPVVQAKRADYALLAGDFSGFTIMPVETDPEKDLLYNQTDLVSCGFPWGAELACYPVLTKVQKFYEGFGAQGQMYPTMSGGPVIDTKTGKVVGVNSGIKGKTIIFMPVIGLWVRLGEYGR